MRLLKDLITYLCLQLQMPLAFREKPRKGEAEAGFCFFNVCFILFWFWLFGFGHTRKHLTYKIMYTNVLNKWAYYSGTTIVILLYITFLACYQIQLWGACQEVNFSCQRWGTKQNELMALLQKPYVLSLLPSTQGKGLPPKTSKGYTQQITGLSQQGSDNSLLIQFNFHNWIIISAYPQMQTILFPHVFYQVLQSLSAPLLD